MSNKIELSNITDGSVFKIGDIEFIKFSNIDGVTTAVTKDIVFKSTFGSNNNFKESGILKRLEKELLPKISEQIGDENICDITTDLTTLDGLKTYGTMTSKVSLPTFEFYRNNVEIFDKYKVDVWWWTATPDSSEPHRNNWPWVVCVSPSGFICRNDYFYGNIGVRPFFRFVSSIFVSSEE